MRYRFYSPVRLLMPMIALVAMVTTSVFGVFPTHQVANAQSGLNTVQTSDGRVSIDLPSEWVTIDLMDTSESLFVFGSSDSAAEGRLRDIRGEPALITGEGGVVQLYSLEEFGIDNADTDVLTTFIDIVISDLTEGTLLEDAVEAPLANGGLAVYAVIDINNEQGFIGFFGYENYIALVTATGTTQSFSENRDVLEQILLSVSSPAVSGDVAENSGDTGDTDAGSANLFASENGEVSVILPDEWTIIDDLDANGLFVFGDTEAGAQTRRDFTLADDQSNLSISDSGGVIQIFDPAILGIDPANPDVLSLLQEIEANFDGNGWFITQYATEFAMSSENSLGAYSIVNSGVQYGYVAILYFEEGVALVTATAATEEDFPQVQDLLFSVVESISIPAQDPSEVNDSGTKFPGLGESGAALPQKVSAPNSEVIISLPQDWISAIDTDTGDDNIKAYVYLGETQSAVDALAANNYQPVPSGLLVHITDGAFPDLTVAELFDRLLPETANADDIVLETFNDAEAAYIVYDFEADYRVYYGIAQFGNGEWALFRLGTNPEGFEESSKLLESIFKSLATAENAGLGSN